MQEINVDETLNDARSDSAEYTRLYRTWTLTYWIFGIGAAASAFTAAVREYSGLGRSRRDFIKFWAALMAGICSTITTIVHPLQRSDHYDRAQSILEKALRRYETGQSTIADLAAADVTAIDEAEKGKTNKHRHRKPGSQSDK